MALRRDDTSSGCSWIPTTPAKLGSTEQQLICTNSEENQSVQAKWLESERLNPVNQAALVNLTESRSVGDFLEESSYHNIPACCSSNSANVSEGGQVNSQVYGEALCNFDIWQSGSSCVHGEELRVYDNMNDAEKWVNMSFTDLLALADAGTNTMSFGNSLAPKLDSLPGGRFDGGKCVPETPFGGISIHSRLSFDHNTLPRTFQHAALSTSTLSHFEPITPEKNWQVQHRQDSTAMQELSTDDWPTKEAQNNTVTKEEVEGHNENKKLSQLLNSQLCTTTPEQLKENHKPDKKGTDEVDITKTPQQKSRRKKHRPKVIKEGKTKSTPKLCPEKPLGPQETIRVKRKYTRRVSVNNSISSPSQGEANETDANTKAAIAKDTPVGKRQRTNRKAVCKPEGTVDMGAIKTVDQMTGGSTRSSCRRSLNFDSECQVRDECSMYIQSSNCNKKTRAENFSRDDQSRTNVKHRQSKEVMMEKNEMGIAHGITGFIYQELDDYMSVHEKCSPSSAPPAETDQPQKDNYLSDRSLSVKGKCQIVFSDVTNDKEVNTVQLTANISNDSINSSLLTPDRLAGRYKRHVDTTAKDEQYSNDSTETLNYSIPRDQFIFLQRTSKNCGFPEMHFPVVSKRNKSEMGFNTTTNSQYSNVKVGKCTHIAQLLPSATNQGSSYLQCQATEMPMGNSSATQDGRQVFDLLALGTGEKVRKRKSKAPTQVQNSISILEMPVSQGADTKKLKNGKTIGQHAHVKALIADASSPVPKVHLKRILPNSIVRNGYNHRELPAISNGSPLAITWKHLSQIDSIVDQLNQLNLNAETSQISTQNQHAFVADHMHFQMQGAIVPYQRGGAVVAFNGSFDQVRKRQPRPKVDLDDETARVWKLLLENINSEGIDGTDEHNAKWWEEERRVFSGRADSFIARMHLVQGDRRFSPWKGSVVDSVVGVFLTQNVSDHLSSSAFMSLAARFPLKAKAIPAELHEARVGTIINEPVICMLEPEETVGSNKNIVLEPVRLDDVKLLNDIENGDIGVVNSVNSLGNSSDDIVAKEGLSDISQCSSVISHASASNKSPSLNRDGQDMDEAVSSQTAVIYSQNSADSPIAKTTERTESSQHEHSIEEPAAGIQPNKFTSSTSFVRLLQMAGTELHGVYCNCSYKEEFDGSQKVQSENSHVSSQTEYSLTGSTFATEANVCSMSASRLTPNSGAGAEQAELSKRCSQSYDSSKGKGLPTAEISGLSVECVSQSTMKFTSVTSKECPNFSRPDDNIGINPEMAGKQMSQLPSLGHFEGKCCKINIPQMDVTGSNSNIDISRKSEQNEVNSKNDPVYHPGEDGPKTKGGNGKDKHGPVDWDALRKQALNSGSKGGRTANTMDSVDWEAVRRADVSEVADAVKERGMNNKLAERIKDFLDRIVRDHESADLEWLREVPPDKAKEYLLSIRGLGLKSVECVRLLTLHQLAFPVDTNVGRIAVRLGWVPLQPLPESLQLHLLELYPVLESIQKYLWPRLCKLDQKTLYELHYQLITFGKVFCTKSRPNCNACPMRGECRHFASAFASARLALPAPEDKSIVSAAENKSAGQTPTRAVNTLELPAPQANHMDVTPRVSNSLPIVEEPKTPEPIIELPATPETEDTQILECDIEDTFYEDPEEIPSIQLNMEEFTQNLQKVMQQNTELQEGSMSNALVALTREAASIPVPKLKNVSRLRTEHQVYELPDSHPLLQGMEQREPDDPSPYLLAIWTPGETVNSIEPPERRCSSQESEKLCTDETCSSCNSKREINSLTVRGTLLIPCRTAMRGSFPLNGTYFQVNEVFSDHESSLAPIDVPREWLWNLPRRIVYFGTSVPTIFKGLTTEQIQYCFWRGFVCVRGFDRKARAPRPLIARLHFPASKMAKGKGKTGEN